MFSCLTEHGRLGLTAVGDTAEDARRIYRTAETVILDEADLALVERPIVD